MKLPIKKKYFDMIKSGEKVFEWRDAHITFVCEETGEQLRKDVRAVDLKPIEAFTGLMDNDKYGEEFFDCFEDDLLIEFHLTHKEGK